MSKKLDKMCRSTTEITRIYDRFSEPYIRFEKIKQLIIAAGKKSREMFFRDLFEAQ